MQVLFSRHFSKKYDKLPKPLQRSSNERLKLLLLNPTHPLLNKHALTAEWAGCSSINVTGNYRAIYRHEGQSAVCFLTIGTHPELYGK